MPRACVLREIASLLASSINFLELLVLHEGFIMAAEKFGFRGQAWFCTSGIHSDIVIEVDGMSWHLHKFPLMAKSGMIWRMITEMEETINKPTRKRGHGEEDEEEEPKAEEDDCRCISLPDFPGNSETFEAAAKFCYGAEIELTAWNVAPLRCAAEHLEMTEEFFEDNLVACTERFLAQSVLVSIEQSIKALKSCEDLLPLADHLGIAPRCVDAIAAGASVFDPASLFGWPIDEGSRRGEGGRRRRSRVRFPSFATTAGSWSEDLAVLSLPMYKRVIEAMKARELNSEVIEGTLISYARKSIPGLSRSRRRHSSAPISPEPEQRGLLETVVSNLPSEKNSAATPTASFSLPAAAAATSTKFLFGLLRTIHILHASDAALTALERKIASQLDRATLDDLLIPNHSSRAETTLYDVDCIERIIAHYLDYGLAAAEKASVAIAAATTTEEDLARAAMCRGSIKLVGKLVDAYLAEIASDANLKADKFCDLAVALPNDARLYHDGLYRAVDIYIKAHPHMTEEEEERICELVDFRKLTQEACTHAAQNERLPLRSVVRVLLFEQLQLRHVIAGTMLVAEAESRGREEDGALRAAMRENQDLQLELDGMRSRVQVLELEYSSMRTVLSKLEEVGKSDASPGGVTEEVGGLWRRRKVGLLGCRFSTQVCDSHQRKVVESRR